MVSYLESADTGFVYGMILYTVSVDTEIGLCPLKVNQLFRMTLR